MEMFSWDFDKDENIGEIVLESLLSSNIDSINDLNFTINNSWFNHPITKEERYNNVELLCELISKQASLEEFSL